MTNDEKIAYIAEHYKTQQYNKAIEELSELITALSRYIAAKDERLALDNVTEEMADVEIMLKQLRLILDNNNDVDAYVVYKLDRTIAKIRMVVTK